MRRLFGGDPPHRSQVRPLPHALLRRGLPKRTLEARTDAPLVDGAPREVLQDDKEGGRREQHYANQK